MSVEKRHASPHPEQRPPKLRASAHPQGTSTGLSEEWYDPDLDRFPVSPTRSLLHQMLVTLYDQYWGTGLASLKSTRPFVHLPSLDNMTLGRVYFFKQYEYMEERVGAFRENWAKRGSTEAPLPPGVALLGNPGIGKSIFLKYYLARELALRRPAVFYIDDQLYVFSWRGVHRITESFEFTNVYWSILGLIDTDASKPPPPSLTRHSPLFLLQAASPNPAHTRWIKNREMSVAFVLNPPSQDELFSALDLHKHHFQDSISGDDIRTIISTYGCNLRTLRSIFMKEGVVQPEMMDGVIQPEAKRLFKSAENQIQLMVKGLSFTEFRRLLTNENTDTKQASHTLIVTLCNQQPQPSDVGYNRQDTMFSIPASPAVWRALLDQHGREIYLEMRHTFDIFSRIPPTGPAAGWLWEAWGHQYLSRGGEFAFFPMVENGNYLVRTENENSIMKLTFARTTPTVFSSKSLNSTTLDPANYFIPSASNNPTFDSFFRLDEKGFGVQLTIGKEHDLDKKGLRMLYSRLEDSKERYFVFVIPPGRQLRCEKPSTLYMGRFKYFVLELPISDATNPNVVAFIEAGLEMKRDGELVLPSDDKTEDDDQNDQND